MNGWGARGALLALALIALLLGHVALLVVGVVLGVVAVGESLRAARARGLRPSAIVALAGTVAILAIPTWRGETSPRVFPAVIAFVVGLAFVEQIIRRERVQVTRSIAYTLLPVSVVGLLGGYVMVLRSMPRGFRLTLVLVAMAAATELAAPLAARVLKRDPSMGLRFLAAQGGALVIAIVARLAASDTFAWDTAIVLGILMGAAVPTGRLVGEMIERDLSPSGALSATPILRRLDGLLIAAPVYFYAFRALAR